jgi:ligand-binding sensor domain-containing protein/two-component sensor histidine kinase
MRKIVNLLFLCWLSIPATGQLKVFTSYTVSQGLSSNAIRKIFQDSKGYIWVGTWEGLNKYDGSRFHSFTTQNGLPHNLVNDIRETSGGQIMVSTNDGNTSLIENDRVLQPPQFSGITINRYFPDENKGILALTDLGKLFSIRNGQLLPVSRLDSFALFMMAKATDGCYYVMVDKNRVLRFNNDFTLLNTIETRGLTPQCISADKAGHVFIGTEKGLKVIQADPTHTIKQTMDEPGKPFSHPLLLSGNVSAIYPDPEKGLWFGTHAGLIKLSEQGNFQLFTEKDGLPSGRISYITRDRENNLWIGTFSGLAKMSAVPISLVPLPGFDAGTNRMLTILAVDDEKFLVLTTEGVFSYHLAEKKFKLLLATVLPQTPLPVNQSNPPRIIYNNHLYIYDTLKDILQQDKLSWNTSSIFAAASNEEIIALGYNNGLVLQFAGMPGNRILDSCRINNLVWTGKGELWAGSWSNGIYRVIPDLINKKISSVQDFTSIAGSRSIRALFEDNNGNLWIGTRYDGLIVLSKDAKGNWKKTQIRQENGLLSEWISSILETKDHIIWAGTPAGLNKIVTSKDGYRVFRFSRMLNFFTTIYRMVEYPGNQFWCATDKGLLNFTDKQLENQPAFPVYFTSVKLGKADSNYAHAKNLHRLRLKHFQNYAAFSFTSTGFLNESELQYSYRLLGSGDSTWSNPANIHEVQYASLQPGQYKFEVKMLGLNGDFGPVNSFPFAISKPFWKTWIFFLALGLIILSLLYALYKYRVMQLVKLHQVRNSIATDLHDEIGSTLTNISILSQLSINSLKDPAEAKKFLTRIRDEVQSSNQALDDIIWSVNSRNDSLNETMARMRRFAGDLFDKTETVYNLEITGERENRKLNMEQRRDMYLIYKESLINIHKHAYATKVDIHISQEKDILQMEICDDGKGFDMNAASHRNGLKNLKYRVEKWKGSIAMHSYPGKGTKIRVSIPISEN